MMINVFRAYYGMNLQWTKKHLR